MFAETQLQWWGRFLLRIIGAIVAGAAIVMLMAGAASIGAAPHVDAEAPAATVAADIAPSVPRTLGPLP